MLQPGSVQREWDFPERLMIRTIIRITKDSKAHSKEIFVNQFTLFIHQLRMGCTLSFCPSGLFALADRSGQAEAKNGPKDQPCRVDQREQIGEH